MKVALPDTQCTRRWVGAQQPGREATFYTGWVAKLVCGGVFRGSTLSPAYGRHRDSGVGARS